MAMSLRSHRLLGLPVAATTYREAFEQVSEWAELGREVRLVEAANTHVLALARHERAFGEIMAEFDLLLPDGMPLVWVLNRRHGEKLQDRVYGPTLMARSFEWSQEPAHRHLRHFLLGSTPEILEKLQANLAERYPQACIAGSHSPPFGAWEASDREAMADAIREAKANFIWTCFGCPKQERTLVELKSQLSPGVYFGIGAAFAFHAGAVRQAPAWIQRLGMEWFFRMCMEPRRLFKRYLVNNSRFLWYLLRDEKKTSHADDDCTRRDRL